MSTYLTMLPPKGYFSYIFFEIIGLYNKHIIYILQLQWYIFSLSNLISIHVSAYTEFVLFFQKNVDNFSTFRLFCHLSSFLQHTLFRRTSFKRTPFNKSFFIAHPFLHSHKYFKTIKKENETIF